MTTNFQQVRSIFLTAIERPADARDAYLAEACGDDPALREKVDLLLQAHDSGTGFLDNATRTDVHPHLLPNEQAGMIIARRYKLLEIIGEGGMGAVWVAEQIEPVRRKVALKLIKAGMDSKSVLARFEAERQALAVMDHPNIAKVLDGGLTDAGRPYFVMEYVKGVPITDYCDATRLNVAQRLELFTQVCQAVQHAHQKGIIHRDLKPSNILVAPYDDKPVPKVIDFGLAKAMHQSLTDKTLHTAHETVLGTPLYMSPEQAQLNNLDVDTRSDVYSLGVLLYELLTGTTPLEKQRLKEAAWDEVRRIIREEEPPLPSLRLSTAQTLPKLAAGRQIEPARLTKMVRGELDWIVMKALEKERNRRYETASGLAMDVQRYLTGEPVLAAPPSLRYRLGKLAAKHRAALSAVAAIIFLLLAGVTVSTWQAIRATRAEASESRRADSERLAKNDLEVQKSKADDAAAAAKAASEIATKRLDQVLKANDMLGSIFWTLDPKEIAKNDRPLQAILVEKFDKAIAQLDGDSIGDPLVVAAMQHTFGGSLVGLGQPQKAVTLLEKALATRKELLGPAHRDTLMTMNHLALAYHDTSKLDLALKLLEEAFKVRQTNAVLLDEEMLMSGCNLAQLYIETGKRELGIALFEETLKLSESVLGPDHLGTLTLTITNNLAIVYQNQGEPKRALPLYEKILKQGQLFWGPNNPQTLTCMDNLAGCYMAVGKHHLGIAMYEEAFKRERVILGIDHVSTLTSMHNLAGAYREASKLDLALPLGEEALKLLKIKAGPEHQITISCMDSLARTYQATGKYDLALPLHLQALTLAKKIFPPDDFETLTIMNNLADLYRQTDRRDLAIPLFEETLKRRRARLGDGNPATVSTMNSLAVTYYKEKQYDKAIALYEESLKHTEAMFGRDHENTVFIIAYLGQNYKDAGQIDKAVPLLEETWRNMKKYPDLTRFGPTLVECYTLQGKNNQAAELSKTIVADATKANPEDKRLYAGELASKARALLDKQKFAEAEPLLKECLTLREKLQPGEWLTFNTQSMLGYALMGQKKYEEAEPLLIAGYEGLKKVESKIFPPAKNRLTESLQRLVVFYQSRSAHGDQEKADKYYKLLLENPLHK